MPEVTLKANGFKMGGWTTVSIRKSTEQLAHDFSLEVTNQRVGPLGQTVPTGVTTLGVRNAADELTNADECTIEIDGKVIITGFLDTFAFDYDDNAASLRLSGRSKTGDLVDCSAIYKTGVWKDATLARIVADLCEPYGITAFASGPTVLKPFKSFKLEEGETAFDAISRACNQRSVLPITLADGSLACVQASKTPSGAVIELGKNVLEGSVSRDYRDRFSNYLFKGQTAASDDWSGKSASQLEGSIDDTDVERYRPLVVLSQKQRTREDMGNRALWERNVRAGRSARYSYTVDSWTFSSGSIWATGGDVWETNTLARVKDEWSDVDEDLLITSAEFNLDANSRTARIELLHRSAFDVLALPPKRKRRA